MPVCMTESASTPAAWPPPVWPPPPYYPSGPVQGISTPLPSLPLRAGMVTLLVTVASLAGSRLVLELLGHLRLPIVVYLALAVTLGYLPMLWCCIWVSRTWGTGNVGDDLGFRFRVADLGWGPLVWVACFSAEVVMAIVIHLARVPLENNTESLENLGGERGVLIALLLTAVVAAPFVEELVFRGVLLRSFASRLPIWASVGLQGVLFGVAHVDPARGVGNVGLVLVLSSVGAVLGGAAVLLRRIGPTVAAHAILNGIVMIVVLALR